MHRASHDTTLISSYPIGGQVIGINLGWSFAVEHEWGIRGIVDAFGIPGKPRHGLIGADVRTITKVPKGLKLLEFGDAIYLMYSSTLDPEWNKHSYGGHEPTVDDLNHWMEIYQNDNEISAAWSENDFGVRLRKTHIDGVIPIHTAILGQIYEALQQKDAMIFLGDRFGAFSNRGLIIAIRSRMPEYVLSQMKDNDENYLKLVDTVTKIERETEIKKKLKAAGKRFFALSPRWADENEKKKTQYDIVYWLTPENQSDNNYGWFTVEQLLEWTKNKGPIPIQKSATARTRSK